MFIFRYLLLYSFARLSSLRTDEYYIICKSKRASYTHYTPVLQYFNLIFCFLYLSTFYRHLWSFLHSRLKLQLSPSYLIYLTQQGDHVTWPNHVRDGVTSQVVMTLVTHTYTCNWNDRYRARFFSRINCCFMITDTLVILSSYWSPQALSFVESLSFCNTHNFLWRFCSHNNA